MNPQGTNIIDYINSKAKYTVGNNVKNYTNLLVPLRPDIEVLAGTWRYSFSTATDVRLSVRSHREGKSQNRIQVQTYLTSRTAEAIASSLEIMSKIYRKNGIELVFGKAIVLTSSEYRVVSPSFTNATTSSLVGRGMADSVNLFFIEDLRGSGSSNILGMAAGIPGSLGIRGSYNGVLINISAHERGSHLDSQLLGETAAHEMGHQLGLFHPSENRGTLFDPLDDTAECPRHNDKNGNGVIDAKECLGRGVENLMFWTSWQGGAQDNLTVDQIKILKKSILTY